MTSYNRSAAITLVILPLFLSWVFPQMQNEPFSDRKSGKEYYIQYAMEKPSIDGFLNDPCWTQIIPITDFLQEYPNNMAEPSEKSEVYLTYDERSLYIAARLYDSVPSDIVRQLAPRDDWDGAFDEMADWFSIDLDSYHDHQTGFSFAINASGVIYDEMVYHDEDFDSDWNAIWEAEVHIDDKGWSLEIEIPFSNLPFYNDDKLLWGMNITRFIQRKYETITWVTFPIHVGGVVSQYGHLHGLKGIYPPAKFEFRPYSMAGNTNYSDIRLTDHEIPKSHRLNYTDHPRYDIGMDIQYRIKTNSKLTFTINPDFGQVESDPADINLTAFETYFQEKRPFFLNDVDIFETPMEIFYSRRIGEKDWGAGVSTYIDTLRKNINQNDCASLGGNIVNNACIDTITMYYDMPVTIKGAGKLTGRTESGLSYGLLGAVTTLDDSSSWTQQMMKDNNRNYFISRLKQDLFSGNSYIGVMSTSSQAPSAHIFSIDGMANLFDNQIGIDGQFFMSADEHTGAYGSMSSSPLEYLNGWVDYFHYDKGLKLNTLGYLLRDDFTKTKVGVQFQSLEPWYMVRNAYVILEGDMEENSDGIDLGKTIELSYEMYFDNFWSIGGGFYNIMEHYDDRKIILDYDLNEFGPPIFIPEVMGSYFNISTDKHHTLWASIACTWASNTRDDTERGQYVELTYKPNPYLYFSTSYDRYRLEKQYHWLESFDESLSPLSHEYHHIFSDLNRKIDVLTFRVIGNINRKLSVHGYSEIYSNHDMFDKASYSEYNVADDLFEISDYILGAGDWDEMPVYTYDESELDASYLDPYLYLGLYPKFTSFVFNGIVKWNYMKGSNIYFVYSFNKSVNGKPFSGIEELRDFLLFNDKQDWVEVLRDQTFVIKIDYWFEK